MGSSAGGGDGGGARMMMACGGGWIAAGWAVGGVIDGRIIVIWLIGMRDWTRGCGGGGMIDGRGAVWVGAWMMMVGRIGGARMMIG